METLYKNGYLIFFDMAEGWHITTGHQEKPTEQRSAGCAMTKSKSFGDDQTKQ